MVQEPDLNSAQTLDERKKKKKKKKKRRHSEVEADPEPEAPPAPVVQTQPPESANENKRRKKKKRRKTELEDGGTVEERECVPSHLDTSNQEEDWCQGGIWSLTSHPGTEQSEPKPQSASAPPTQQESSQEEQGRESFKSKKKKKKKKQLVEVLQGTTSACSAPERWVELMDIFVQNVEFLDREIKLCV